MSRKFIYKRGDYSIQVDVTPTGHMMFSNIRLPASILQYTEEYNVLVGRMMDDAEDKVYREIKKTERKVK